MPIAQLRLFSSFTPLSIFFFHIFSKVEPEKSISHYPTKATIQGVAFYKIKDLNFVSTTDQKYFQPIHRPGESFPNPLQEALIRRLMTLGFVYLQDLGKM